MKRKIATALQCVVTVALLYWLFRDPDTRAGITRAIRTADRSWLLLGIGIHLLVDVFGAWRWHLLLRVQDIRLPWLRVLRLFMVGVFFNIFLPGAVGGDVVKIYYLLKETAQQKAAAFLTVLMDRLIGLIALVALGCVLVAPQYELFADSPTARALFWTFVFIVVNAIGGIAVTFVITGLDLVRKLPERLPGHARLVEMAAAYNLYARAWKPSLGAFALSIGAHVAYFATFYCAARAFTEAVSLGGLFIVMPVVNVIAALPISVAGVGVREGLFEQLLGNLYGVPGDIALLVSLTGFAIVVLWSALGGLIYLTYRPSEHARLSQIEAEVAKVEDKITQQ